MPLCRASFLRPIALPALFPCLPALAQNSGGGWVAQPTNQLGPYPNNQPPYDWTGFTISGTTVGNNGSSNSGSSICYSTYNGHGVFVGNMYNRSSTTTSSGASTYEWLWTPTGSNVGAPPPPLYVLAIGAAVADFSYGSNAKGLSGSGTLTYGSVVSDYFSGTASAKQVPLYKLPLASGSPNVSVSIGPVINHSYSGTPTGDYGVITEVLQTVACPIVVSAPNPMNRPDLGDGTNQYVYDATTPTGLLKFPGSVQVVGATAPDTEWIMRDPAHTSGPHVALTVDLPSDSVLQQSQLYDQTLLASVPADSLVIKNGPYSDRNTSMADGYVYAGLPKSNGGFGNHLVTLTVDGSASQQAHIQTFFTGTASNYPASAKDQNTNGFATPNWYYYYNQASSSGGTYDGTNTDPQFFAYTDYWAPYAIHIETGTYNTISVPIFDINPTVDASTKENLVRCVGTLSASGIQSYAYICAHEKGHQTVFGMNDSVTGLPIYSPGTQGQPWEYGPNSTDSDHVLDAWESRHHLNPTNPNTTGYYGDSEPGDDEVLADVQALSSLFTNRDLWTSDWANGGLQYTNGQQLYWYKTQVANGQILKKPVSNPVFYWKFTPRVAGTPTQASGTTAFQVGPSSGPFGDGTYPIQTLADLSSQYPTVLIALP